MKLFFLFLMLSSLAHAEAPLMPMSMKERIRLSLWSEGLAPSQKPFKIAHTKKLPEEIEKPLRKL